MYEYGHIEMKTDTHSLTDARVKRNLRLLKVTIEKLTHYHLIYALSSLKRTFKGSCRQKTLVHSELSKLLKDYITYWLKSPHRPNLKSPTWGIFAF